MQIQGRYTPSPKKNLISTFVVFSLQLISGVEPIHETEVIVSYNKIKGVGSFIGIRVFFLHYIIY